MYLHLYMDDMLIASKYNYEIDIPKHLLNNMFEIKDLGSTKKNLRIEVIKNRAPSTFLLSQERYIKKGFRKFDMYDNKIVTNSCWYSVQAIYNISI